MSEILLDFSPSAVLSAIEANIYGFTLFGRLPQGEMCDDSKMLWFISGLPSIFNMVLYSRLEANEVDDRIEITLQRFRTRHVPITWMIGPSTRPADLGKRLEAHGLTHTTDWTGMAVDLHAMNDVPPPSGLIIERASTVEALKKWASILTSVFTDGSPHHADALGAALINLGIHRNFGENVPWRCYLAVLNGEPVACSALLLSAGVAAVHAVATVPQARGQGIGSAVTLAPLRDARAGGYRIGVLKASDMGFPVYRRLGFQEYFTFEVYGWPPGYLYDATGTLKE